MSDHAVVLALSRSALTALERNRRRLDDLNVYPVPDGDTGTNLTLTVRSVVEALEGDDVVNGSRPALARLVARAALMGARGNSGVILSQIVRGATDVLGSAADIDGPVVAAGLRSASDAAYAAVREPVEGTILTAIRALADEAEEAHANGDLVGLLARIVRRGDDAVVRTQEQLAVLRDAGVVDAGAAGLVEVVRGIASYVGGEPLPEAPADERAGIASAHQELSAYRYCTVFVIEGEELEAAELEREVASLGDSLLVVGDSTALKIHIHTDDPGRVLQLATAAGVVEAVEVTNMHRQTAEREARLLGGDALEDEPAASAVIAVSVGRGNRRLFESFDAQVVDGGATMNPSTEALLEAIESVRASGIVLLPNDPNVFMAAEQAARLASRPVRVVPSASIQAGLASMVAHDPARSAEENAAEMEEAVASAATGAVTVASRAVDGIAAEGDYLGLVAREPLTGGSELAPVAEDVIAALLAEPRDLLTILTGEDEPELDGLLEAIERRWPDVELEVQRGGQPHYPILVWVE